MYLLIDIGGTNLRVGTSLDLHHLDKVESKPTPKSYKDGLKLIGEIVKLLNCADIDGCCVGISGSLDKDKTSLTASPHLEDWINQPLKEALAKKLKCPVYLENDAALAGLGEASFGAGQNYSIVAYLTVSTGVGGARVVDQAIDQSSLGFEPGHQIISSKGHFKELEDYVSGSGLMERYHQDPATINDPSVWREVEKYLAIGLDNTILYWSPDIVVLNGPIIHRISLTFLKNQLEQILKIFPRLPEIKIAQLGDEAGLWGGMKYLKNYA